jgi:predicted amidophosphoribosyltransferase
MSCNGICERYKAKRNPIIPSRYKEGQKRCSVCKVFIKWNENYCPCCNYKLRTRSFRGFGMRKIHREEIINRY